MSQLANQSLKVKDRLAVMASQETLSNVTAVKSSQETLSNITVAGKEH